MTCEPEIKSRFFQTEERSIRDHEIIKGHIQSAAKDHMRYETLISENNKRIIMIEKYVMEVKSFKWIVLSLIVIQMIFIDSPIAKTIREVLNMFK